MLGKGIINWSLQWDFPLGMVSYFTPLGEGELLNFHWDPFVLLQAGPAETHYTHAIEKGENMEVLVWPISPLVHLLMPDSTASPTPTNNRYNIHNQVKLLKLPQGQIGTFYFPVVRSFGCHLFSLRWPGGHYSPY